jgi:hypothetical protein
MSFIKQAINKEHLPSKQAVEGSNPSAFTNKKYEIRFSVFSAMAILAITR